MPEIATVSHRHEAIMNFMIANPTAKLGQVAAEFGVSQPWLSCIIHSHAFKTKLREKQEALWGDLGASITEKLEAVAHTALDNILEHVTASNASPALSLEVADKVLHRLGYAPKTGPAAQAAPAAQVNVFNVSPADLAAARQVMAAQAAAPALTITPAGVDGPGVSLEDMSDVHSQGSDGSGLLADPAPVSSQD